MECDSKVKLMLQNISKKHVLTLMYRTLATAYIASLPINAISPFKLSKVLIFRPG